MNALVDERGAANPRQLARLERLLQALELPPELATVALDWIDAEMVSYASFGPHQPRDTKARSRRVELAVVVQR